MPQFGNDHVTPRFREALQSLRRAHPRPEVEIVTIPEPASLAPFAVAISADVFALRGPRQSSLATGRLVLLHDPVSPESWDGDFRIICFAKAALEPDLGLDPVIAAVVWSQLVDALTDHGAESGSLSGTVTKTINAGFGELASQSDGTEIEIRASWTPSDTEIAAHVEAWTEVLCALAGLPPLPDGVRSLEGKRHERDR